LKFFGQFWAGGNGARGTNISPLSDQLLLEHGFSTDVNNFPLSGQLLSEHGFLTDANNNCPLSSHLRRRPKMKFLLLAGSGQQLLYNICTLFRTRQSLNWRNLIFA
jgi:hypothetical protein